MTTLRRFVPSFARSQPAESRLIRELRIVERARADGRRNYPGPDCEDLSQTESLIMTRISDAIGMVHQAEAVELGSIRNKMRALQPTPAEVDTTAPLNEARARFRQSKSERTDNLSTAFAERRKRQQDLVHFQRSHELSREANYGKQELLVFLLIAMVSLEVLVNMQLFARTSELGAVGGVIRSLFLCGANFLLGFIVVGATGCRLAGHVSATQRVFGWTAIVLGVVSVLSLNLWAAVWRESLILELEERGGFPEAWALFTAEPITQLSQNESMFLILLGLASAGVFAFKGASLFEDRYPGYAKVDHLLRKAEKEFTREAGAFRAELPAFVAQARAQVEKSRALVDQRQAKSIALLGEHDRTIDKSRASVQACAGACNRLVSILRTENEACRDLPIPKSWDHVPALDTTEPDRSAFGIHSLVDDISRAHSAMTKAADEAFAALDQLEEQGLKEIEQIIARPDIRSVQAGAQRPQDNSQAA